MPLKKGGIDVVAVLQARMKGWETRTFTERFYTHHRTMGGGGAPGIGCVGNPAGLLTCPASFGVAAVLMLTKAKNHWFYVVYKQDGGTKELALRLDKREYEQVLKTAREQTGKDVEMLVSQKGKSPGKK